MVQTFDISNLDYVINQNSMLEISKVTALGCKYIGIRKSEFVANTQIIFIRELGKKWKSL